LATATIIIATTATATAIQFLPSISLVYEKPEADIMTFPPRNVKVDRLVSLPLLGYSYLQAGLIETGVCLVVYFWVSLID